MPPSASDEIANVRRSVPSGPAPLSAGPLPRVARCALALCAAALLSGTPAIRAAETATVRAEKPAAAGAEKPTTQRFALARYFYGFQADTRKPLPPGQPTRGPKGESLFSVEPQIGIGPWFGYGHAMWHRDNLQAMRRAGIDVALPVFRADPASLAGYAEAGLDSLAEALIELKREQLDYPLVGMYYDTTSLASAPKGFDVGTDAGKAAFYNGIRRFFLHVPEEFRALAQTPDGLACVLAVGPTSPLQGVDTGLRAYCDEHFRQDFGRGLLWIGGDDWKTAGVALDGCAQFNDGRALAVDTSGPLSIATIGPGYNDTGLQKPDASIRSRNAGLTMIDDWRQLFQTGADWIVVETWNDFAHGSAVAPSRTFGVRETDQTMAGLLQFRGESGLVTQALRVNAPEVVPPKAVVPIEVVVQNGSLQQWGRGNILFGASWYQDGKLVEEGPKVPVMQTVPMMGLLNVPVAAVTARADGSPLPEGAYELRVEFFAASVDEAGKPVMKPFAAPAAVIPIRIGTPPAPAARLITSDASPYLMAGADCAAKVVVRNDGPAPWPKGKTRLAWRVVSVDAPDAAPIASGESAPYDADVPAGMLSPVTDITVRIPKDAAPSRPGEAEYALMWDIVTGADRIPVTQAPNAPARRSVEVLPTVSIAHFPFGNSAPNTWPAGTEQDIRTVVRNIGQTTWTAADYKVGYHWYYWDGTEALWEGQKTALPRDVKPGEDLLVHVTATAPEAAGAYVFVVDIWDGKQWISTLPATAGYDTSLAYVNVTGGNLRPVDLTGLFDVDGIASEINPADGDFADGFAYPGEQIPPDIQPPLPISGSRQNPYPPGIVPILYPAGYFGPVDTVGLQSIHRVAFRYPSRKDGDRNFMLGRGQDLPLGVGAYNRIYLLGAATEDTSGSFRLNYADGTSEDVSVPFSAWTAGPQHGEAVGLECTFRRSARGDDPSGPAYLYVYEVPVNPSKVLQSVTLPENRKIRIAAITTDQKPTFQLPAPVK